MSDPVTIQRKALAREIRELARMDSVDAYEVVVRIMHDDGHRQQLTAALAVLKAAGVAFTPDEQPERQVPASPSAPANMTDAELEEGLGPTGELQ